jgi:LPXTG-motif cell wall-anchored protein
MTSSGGGSRRPVGGMAAGWLTALGAAFLLSGGLLVLASRRRHAGA